MIVITPLESNTSVDATYSKAIVISAPDVETCPTLYSMITRDETPFMSSIGKTKATAIFHEWQTDELTAPGDSRLVEGTDYVVPIEGVAAAAAADQTGLVPVQDNDQVVTSTGAQYNISGPNRTR